MEYEYGIKNVPHEYDENNLYNENETNLNVEGIVHYELYSVMAFFLLFFSICSSIGCNLILDKRKENLKDKLIENKVEEYKDDDNFKIKDCSICLEDYEDGENILYLECGHYYHKKCSKNWFKDGNTCPLCRASFA